MKLSEIDTKKQEYTDDELDALVDILIKAKEIEGDSTLYKVVQAHMKKKTKAIKSVADLKAKAAELASGAG